MTATPQQWSDNRGPFGFGGFECDGVDGCKIFFDFIEGRSGLELNANVAQSLSQFGHGLIAFCGIAAQAFRDDGIDGRGHILDGFGCGSPAHGFVSGQHFVQHDAEAVNVGACVDVGGIFQLFGRHVVGRTHDHGGGGEIGIGHEFGNAEVHQFYGTVFLHHDVFGFQVAVDGVLVRVFECGAEAVEHAQDGVGRQALPGPQSVDHGAEGSSTDHFHGDVDHAVGGTADVVYANDIGMGESAGDFGFVEKAFDDEFFANVLGQEGFEGDDFAEGVVEDLVDAAHAAASDDALDGVAVGNDFAFLKDEIVAADLGRHGKGCAALGTDGAFDVAFVSTFFTALAGHSWNPSFMAITSYRRSVRTANLMWGICNGCATLATG